MWPWTFYHWKIDFGLKLNLMLLYLNLVLTENYCNCAFLGLRLTKAYTWLCICWKMGIWYNLISTCLQLGNHLGAWKRAPAEIDEGGSALVPFLHKPCVSINHTRHSRQVRRGRNVTWSHVVPKCVTNFFAPFLMGSSHVLPHVVLRRVANSINFASAPGTWAYVRPKMCYRLPYLTLLH